ncbi:MAG: protease modulator HflK, partial [Alphaproteobacteria bacterium]|nr:protease modulator HflK [Alphaproteobacteria bacterium]
MPKIKSPWEDDNTAEENWENISKIRNHGPKAPIVIEVKWWWIVGAIFFVWLASGFYQVQPNEEAIVLRFGAYNETTTPGLHYHLPYPIETVTKVNITQERSINLGVDGRGQPKNMFTESHMLTGDENIVDINLTIVWRIENTKDYVFNMQNPDQTVSVAAQSVLREIVGQSQMMPIISGDRGKVEDETKEELQ